VSLPLILMVAALSAPTPVAAGARGQAPLEAALPPSRQRAGLESWKLPDNTYAVIHRPSVAVYDDHGRWSSRLSGRSSFGSRLTLRATVLRRDRVRLRLPSRDNRRVGWVRSDSLTLHRSRHVVTVDLRGRRLTVHRGNRRIARFPVGIGSPRTPTPRGAFTITDILRITPPGGMYGPYARKLARLLRVGTPVHQMIRPTPTSAPSTEAGRDREPTDAPGLVLTASW
jgi:L,D-transpeptidase catalytic domain